MVKKYEYQILNCVLFLV